MNDFRFRYKFISSFNELIKNDVNIIEALDIMQKSYDKNNSLKIQKVKKSLELGKNFEISFKNISDNKEFLFFLTTAEKTGNLKRVLELLNDKYEFYDKTKKQIINILIYPLILLFIVIIITYTIITNIVPKFIEIYNDLNKNIPAITNFILNFSNFIKQNKIYIIIVLISIIYLIYLLIKKNKYFINKAIYKISFIKQIVLLNFIKNMNICLDSKIQFLDSLKLSSNTNNIYFNTEVKKL